MTEKDRRNNGFTLIEVLASFTILTIILLLLSSIHILGIQSYHTQSDQVVSAANVRQALNLITSDIRAADSSDIQVIDNTLTISNQIKYKQQDGTITRNGTPIAYKISKFNISINGDEITLYIKSDSKNINHPVSASTKIYIRR